MALTKSQKNDVISEVTDLITQSKMTVVAKYQGIDVKSLQQLRKDAKTNNTKVKVIKNRLVVQALKSNDKYKDIDYTNFEGMLLYAFNNDDEVAAAQSLDKFAKTNPSLEFIGAINEAGTFVEASDVKALAALPGKNQLIASVINLLNSPIVSVANGLSGNLSAILSGLEAKASN
jgi:large subunit ribosomal protein L10